MKSILIKDTTREERIRIVHQALWGDCGTECEFCSGCDNRGGGRTDQIYDPNPTKERNSNHDTNRENQLLREFAE